MPRVERTIDTSAEHSRVVAFYSLDCGHENLKVPIGTNNARLIVEWDDPPVNDWTPEDVARCIMNVWFHDENNTRSPISMAVVVANKIAELERAKCAEVVRKRSQLWNAGASVEELMNLCADAILARTNEEAGYPRMEK